MNMKLASPSPAAGPGARLDRTAARLLAALCADGAYAFPDPTAADILIVRGARGGVSLGAGRFPREASEALVRADLAEAQVGGVLRVTAAGRAHRRRLESDPVAGPFRNQHLRVVAERVPDASGLPTPVARDAAESPLAWLARRRGRDGAPFLDAACLEAGERLRRDLTVAALLPRTTLNWASAGASTPTGAPRDPAAASDTVVAARQRVSRALAAVGNDLSGLLVDLCGFLKGLELIEREREWPPRSGKVVVRLALGRLAEHYGLAREACGPARSLGLRAWRDEVTP